jgi:hypothetical protein
MSVRICPEHTALGADFSLVRGNRDGSSEQMTKQRAIRVEFSQRSVGLIVDKAPASEGGRFKELDLFRN